MNLSHGNRTSSLRTVALAAAILVVGAESAPKATVDQGSSVAAQQALPKANRSEASPYAVRISVGELGPFDTALVRLHPDTSRAFSVSGSYVQLFYDVNGYLTSMKDYWDGGITGRYLGFNFVDASIFGDFHDAVKTCSYNGNDTDYLWGISTLFLLFADVGPVIIADSLVRIVNEKALGFHGQVPATIVPAATPAAKYRSQGFRIIASGQLEMYPRWDPAAGKDVEEFDTLQPDYAVNQGSGEPVAYYSPDYRIDMTGRWITPVKEDVDTVSVTFRIASYCGPVSNKLTVPVVISKYGLRIILTGNDYAVVKVGSFYTNRATLTDSRPIVSQIYGKPHWATWDQGTALVTGTPAFEDRGIHTYGISVDDGISAYAARFEVKVTDNDAPVIDQGASIPKLVDGEAYFHEVIFSDPNHDTLRLDSTIVWVPSYLTLRVDENRSVPGYLVAQLSSNGNPIWLSDLDLNDYLGTQVSFGVTDTRDMPELEESVSVWSFLVPRIDPIQNRPPKDDDRSRAPETLRLRCGRTSASFGLKMPAASIRIFDAVGRAVFSDDTHGKTVVDMAGAHSGIFVVVIRHADGSSYSHRFVTR